MTPAPFFADVADAPTGASAFWATATDGVRLRIGFLAPPPDSAKGTVLLFTGRTEYIEKYGPAATELQARGYACLSLDWRGQGLADRALENAAVGHVGDFSEYQADVAEVLNAARALDLPEPMFLVAHSMGGGIGLRALHEGLPVQAAAFSGPMWGIAFPSAFRPISRVYTGLSRAFGFGARFTPSTGPVTYLLREPFEDNTLTTDPEMYNWMRKQVTAHPELALGGPSLIWLDEALREAAALRAMAAPDVPCVTWVGSNERIVDPGAIRDVMRSWQNGTLTEVPGAEHELMMEAPATRNAFFDAATELFDKAR